MREGDRVVACGGSCNTWFCGEYIKKMGVFHIVKPFGNMYGDDRMCRKVLPLNEDTWHLIGTKE